MMSGRRSGLHTRRSEARRAYMMALRIAARALGVPYEQAIDGRDRAASEVRKMAAYLAVVVGDNSRRAVARAMGRDHAVVIRVCREVEERRDGAEFDRLMRRLEARYQARLGCAYRAAI